jgi:Nucleotidyl transferase AbiEii toxin, Type IV TA system
VSLKSIFKSAVHELQERNIRFAVAGGFAADIYRREPRLTMDVDLAIAADTDALRTATAVMEAIGLRAGVIRLADFAGGPLFAIRQKNTKPCMVVGRKAGNPAGEGVDILLPSLPWTENAIARAQDNLVDFGFGLVPVLTVEDVILSKLFAIKSTELRAKDLDDIQSIYAADPELNVPYLAGQMSRLELFIPDQAKPFLPDSIIALARDVARSRKSELINRRLRR